MSANMRAWGIGVEMRGVMLPSFDSFNNKEVEDGEEERQDHTTYHSWVGDSPTYLADRAE